TPDRMLRAPVFIRLRDDVDPESITHAPTPEKVAGASPASRRAGASAGRGTRMATRPVTTPSSEIDAVVEQLDGSKAPRLDLAVEGAKIRMTNLDRVYWPAEPQARRPAITKRDLIRYLARVSRFMLPHLENRPLTMIRMPEGIHGERFFQKHWDAAMPDFVPTVNVFSDHKDEKHRYILANNLPTL